MLRRILITASVAASVVQPVAAAPIRGQTIMPGVVFSRQVEFTAHGPVVVNVVSAPRPTGLYSPHAVLSAGLVAGRAPLSALEKSVSASTTAVGVNGDYFDSRWGTPSSMLIRNGLLDRDAPASRSAAGFDASGTLHVDRVGLAAFWKASDMYRPMGLNGPPGRAGATLYTSTWGAATPAEQGTVEAVLSPFPAAQPNRILTAPVTQVLQGGNQPIPAGGAVLVARGVQAQTLTAQAPVGSTISVRLVLTPPSWAAVLEAVGGGPVLVRNARAIFRTNESFTPSQLFTRTARSAVGQTADGRILLVTVDGGRRGYSLGLTNFELALTMVRLGAVSACGLGSGTSATLAFDGTVLSRPIGRGETPVADALLIDYDGVYVPALPATIAVTKALTLSYKIVRPSSVTATLAAPNGRTTAVDSGERARGAYSFAWTPSVQGRWTFSVAATDELGRESSADRTFNVGPSTHR